MFRFKYAVLALLSLSSSMGFAGAMGTECTPGGVTIPCDSSAWNFAAQALYLESTYSGYNFFGSSRSTDGTREQFNRAPAIWSWDFMVEGAYHFTSGNDLALSWYHYTHTANAVYPNQIDADRNAFDSFNANVQPKWDGVNLELGQHSNLGQWTTFHFHGGVQYARIATNIAINVNEITAAGVAIPIAYATGLKFVGFGPRVGVDYTREWGHGIAMYANTASALLVGDQSFYTKFTTGVQPTYTLSGRDTHIVPELDAKLGATYSHAYAESHLSIDVGWMWVNYFSALHNAAGVFPSLGVTKESHFAVQGPYIGLKWLCNA